MKFSLKKLALFGALTLSLAFSACSSDDSTTNTVTPVAPAAPTALKANSKDSTTIYLKWTAGDTNSAKYIIEIYDNNTLVQTDSSTTSEVSFGGLSEKAYTFRVYSENSTYLKSSSYAEITWAPAHRYSMKVYETKSSTYGSGIKLSNLDGVALFVASYTSWDLGLDTRGADTTFVFGAPTMLTYDARTSGKSTLLSIHTDPAPSAGLDDIWDTEAFTANKALGFLEGSVPVTNKAAATGSYVIAVKTVDNHFAKVLLKVVNGSFLQGTAPNRYMECEVSYQAVANLPYAR